jgi:hypothetical protein
MDIDWARRGWERRVGRSGGLEHAETLLDGGISGVELGGARVGVDRVGDLVVARLVETSQVVPHLADVRVESDCARVGVERVTILVDLVVEHADRTPECRVAAVTIHSLLVRLVCLVVPLTGHKSATEEVPALGVVAVGLEALGEIRHGFVLVGKRRAGLVVEPAELLEDLGVVGLMREDAHIGVAGGLVLRWFSSVRVGGGNTLTSWSCS